MNETAKKQPKKKCGMKKCMVNAGSRLVRMADMLSPLWPLFIRLWMAKIFWNSGKTKFDSPDNTIMLFQWEYMFPQLPESMEQYQETAYKVSAYSAMWVELAGAALIAVGLATRIAAVPLLVMAVVIQYALPQSYYHVEHFYWMMLFAYLVLNGPGKISIDHIVRKKMLSNRG